MSLARGERVLGAVRTSMVWFWILQTRLRRQEREMRRSARMDSIGDAGSSSARRFWRWSFEFGGVFRGDYVGGGGKAVP